MFNEKQLKIQISQLTNKIIILEKTLADEQKTNKLAISLSDHLITQLKEKITYLEHQLHITEHHSDLPSRYNACLDLVNSSNHKQLTELIKRMQENLSIADKHIKSQSTSS